MISRKAQKLQKLPVLRSKKRQNVIFCLQTFLRNLTNFKIAIWKSDTVKSF